MSKAERLKARLPRGFADRTATDLAATHAMLERIREVYELYGFEALETPFVEFTETLGKFLPDLDRPNEGVFSFQDDDEQWLSLRYDLTAPLARHFAEHFETLPKPYRSFRSGWVFRNEKPGPGRFRQFMQFDADTVGSASMAADAEILMMMADTLEKLGLGGKYVVKVNNRKLLDGVMEAIGLAGEENAGRRLTVLRALDKYDRLGSDGVRLLLGAGRRDESGDFTKGAGLTDDQADRLIWFVNVRSSAQSSSGQCNPTIQRSPEPELDMLSAVQEAYGSASQAVRDGVEELRQIAALISAAGYDDGRILIDPSVVRGLEYYTGPVFEAELTFPVVNDDGETVRFGSVAGGGRYDGLVGRFRAEPVPATGFSIGVSRLLSALQIVGSPVAAGRRAVGPVVVLVMDRDRQAEYGRLVGLLRAAEIRAELYLGTAGMKAQMKYADRRGAPCVVIQGSDERARGEVQIKDLVEGAARAATGAPASSADYRSARLAQVSVPETDLVDTVKRILEQQKAVDQAN